MTDQVKFAGKFDTVEQLEEGYKNAAKVYQENEALKQQLESLTKSPDDYNIPQGVSLQDMDEIKRLAKSSGLNQSQFEKLVLTQVERDKDRLNTYEQKKKAIGEEKLNIITDYVNKNYPEVLRETILKDVINDEAKRQAVLSHRERLLNTQTPGMDRAAAISYTVSYDDVLAAREKHEKNKSNMKLRQNYLSILKEYTNQSKR